MPNNIQNWDMAYAMTFTALNNKLKKDFEAAKTKKEELKALLKPNEWKWTGKSAEEVVPILKDVLVKTINHLTTDTITTDHLKEVTLSNLDIKSFKEAIGTAYKMHILKSINKSSNKYKSNVYLNEKTDTEVDYLVKVIEAQVQNAMIAIKEGTASIITADTLKPFMEAAITSMYPQYSATTWFSEQAETGKIVCTMKEAWSFVVGGDRNQVRLRIPFDCTYTKKDATVVPCTLDAIVQLDLNWLKQARAKDMVVSIVTEKDPVTADEFQTNKYVKLIEFTTSLHDLEEEKSNIKKLLLSIINNLTNTSDTPSSPSQSFLGYVYNTLFDSLNIFQALSVQEHEKEKLFKWMYPTTTAYVTIDSNDLEPKVEDSVFGILCMTEGRKNKEKPAIDINIIPEHHDSAIILTPALLMQKILRPKIQTLFKDGTFQEQGGTAFINTKDMHFQTTFKNKKGDEIDPLIKDKSFICRIDNNSLVLNFGEMTYNWIQSWIWNWSLNDTGSVSLQRKCKGTFGKEAISKTGYMLMDSSSVTPLLNNKALYRTGLQVGLSQLPTVINAGYEWWRNRKEKNRFAEQLFAQRDTLAGKYLFAGVDAFKIHKIIKEGEKDENKKEIKYKYIWHLEKIDKDDVCCVLYNDVSKEIFILKVNEANTKYGGFELIVHVSGYLSNDLDGDLEVYGNRIQTVSPNTPPPPPLSMWMNLNMNLLQSIRSILSDLVFNVGNNYNLTKTTFVERLEKQKDNLEGKQIAIGDDRFKIIRIEKISNKSRITFNNVTEPKDNDLQLFTLEVNGEFPEYGGFFFIHQETAHQIMRKKAITGTISKLRADEPSLIKEAEMQTKKWNEVSKDYTEIEIKSHIKLINLPLVQIADEISKAEAALKQIEMEITQAQIKWLNTHQQLLLQIRDVLNHWLSLSLTEYSEYDFRKRLTTAINTKSSINPAGTIKTENFELKIIKLHDNSKNVFVILRETVNTSPNYVFLTNYTKDYIVLKLEITATTYGNLSFFKYIKESDLKELKKILPTGQTALLTNEEQLKAREWNNLYRNDLITIKSYLMEELNVPVLWHMHPYLKLGFKAALDNIISATTKNVASDVLAGGDIEGLEASIDAVLKKIVWPGENQELSLKTMDLDVNFRLSFLNFPTTIKEGSVKEENKYELIHTIPDYKEDRILYLKNTGDIPLTFCLKKEGDNPPSISIIVEKQENHWCTMQDFKTTDTTLYVMAKKDDTKPVDPAKPVNRSYTVRIFD
jgi:Clostridium P-47 protein